MRFHEDERRLFYGDIFDTPNGDINIVYLTPDNPIGWHRHQKQDDQLFLVSGAVRVKLALGLEQFLSHVLSRAYRGPIIIPRGYWHGYAALLPDTVLLQFNGPGKWDGSDEERHPIDAEMPWDAPR